MKLRIIELFAGIGACSTALKRIGIDLEIVDAVEIDKYAIASFNAIHGTNFEPQDITEWNKDLEVDFIMHGSPCQDFSLAGKQLGGDFQSGTRSSLMYETIRIVEKLKPKYVVWENVKNLLSKKHIHNFNNYLEKMSELGYTNYYKVLNAKDYGIPQNRERVFTVSILDNNNFEFPKPQELKLRLKDLLEKNVDGKYYLSDTGIKYFKNQANMRNEKLEDFREKRILTVAHGSCKGNNKKVDICLTLDTQFSNNWRGVLLEPKCVQIGTLYGDTWDKRIKSIKRVYSKEGLSPTITSCQGGGTEPKIAIKNATKKGYDEAIDGDSVNLQYPNSTTRRGRVGRQVSQTLMTKDNMGVIENFKIRKLTPKECWRLMGFSDEDFEKAKNIPTSNTQLYKQAGNSIVVNVLEKIFINLLGEQK